MLKTWPSFITYSRLNTYASLSPLASFFLKLGTELDTLFVRTFPGIYFVPFESLHSCLLHTRPRFIRFVGVLGHIRLKRVQFALPFFLGVLGHINFKLFFGVQTISARFTKSIGCTGLPQAEVRLNVGFSWVYLKVDSCFLKFFKQLLILLCERFTVGQDGQWTIRLILLW